MIPSLLEIIEKMDKLRLIYDLNTCPNYLNMEQVFNVMNNSGIVVYDSTIGNIPIIIEENDLTLQDIKLLNIDEFKERFENLID